MRTLVPIVRLLALSLCLAAPALAQQEKSDRYAGKAIVTVAGVATITVIPSEVVISLGVHSVNPQLSLAVADNNERVARVLDSIEKLGVARKDYQTDSIQLNPRRWDWNSTNRSEPYAMVKTIRVTLRDASQLEALLTAAFEAGVDQLSSVEFRSADIAMHREKARLLAVKAARDKAAAMSGEIGQGLGRALYIEEVGGYSPYGTSYWYGGYYGQSQAANTTINAGGVPVQNDETVAFGQISVTSRVNVVFELK